MFSSVARYRLAFRRTGLGLGTCAALLVSLPAAAQTRFEWPNLSVHFDRLTTASECLAATLQVRDSVYSSRRVWEDTMPANSEDARAPLATPVSSTAKQCAARFTEPTTSLDEYNVLLDLYLFAGRDADAGALVARRLKAVSSRAEIERAAVLDTVASAYLIARPARLAVADSLLSELGKLSVAPWLTRLKAFALLSTTARDAGDTIRARRAAERVVVIGNTLTAADRRTSEFGAAKNAIFRAMNFLDEHVAQEDSLRKSTAAYVALRQANWAKATGERPGALSTPIGKTAPALAGDFWFRRGDASTPRPTKSKVALVVFMPNRTCQGDELLTGASRDCWPAYATLHRMAQRFPELEITLVSQTVGTMSLMSPPAPAAEADSLRSWWLEKRQLSGALVVAKTESWRLPEPDRRRINHEDVNAKAYGFGRSTLVEGFSAFLVDRQGTIVDVGSVGRHGSEPTLEKLTEILLTRHTAER